MLILRFFKELYLVGFTLGFRASSSSWTPGLNAGKGVAGVTIIQVLIFMAIEGWIEMLVGTRLSFDTSPWAIRIAALALYLANYYVLVTRGYGIKFEREFDSLKKPRRVFLLVSCVLMILAAITVTICSVSAYHRVFHIVPKSGF
jgi:hypothetical protein